jgi:hypothetical protein
MGFVFETELPTFVRVIDSLMEPASFGGALSGK